MHQTVSILKITPSFMVGELDFCFTHYESHRAPFPFFFFKHHRKVEHRDGTKTRELAPLKKSIDSIIDLREILLGCNSRINLF
jgi:hypothetical protein